MDLLDRLLAHDVWSTRQLLSQCSSLSDAQFDREFDMDSRSLRQCFSHMIDNMEVWTDLMVERPVRSHSDLPATANSVDGLLQRLSAAGRDFAFFARKIACENRWDDAFTDVLDNPPKKKSFGGAIGHLITHNMHHRAQAMAMMEQVGLRDHIEGDLLTWESIAHGWGEV